ncbi:MAG: hypothetical protein Q9219_006884 [cf. Caloplaca sp. 3 TL-2023]
MRLNLICLIVIASPAISRSLRPINKRNVCDWKNAEPVLYEKYGNDVCPPKFSVGADGSCPMEGHRDHWYSADACAGFCELSTTYSYGKESIFLANPYCHGYGDKGASCTITDTQTTTVGRTFGGSIDGTFNGKIGSIKAGISGSYTQSWAQAHAQAKSVTLGKGECGYWTFLPIVKTTWKTTRDVCIKQGNKEVPESKDGYNVPRGDTIFVRTDCGNRRPLPMDVQDPAYNHPGVPLDRGDYEAVSATWGLEVNALSGISEITCEDIGDESALAVDCSMAMPDWLAGATESRPKGGQYWAGYFHSCAIQVEYDSDWADDCEVTFAEVAKGAAGIYQQCRKGDKVGGVRLLRKDGKCDSKIRITATNGRQRP